MVFLPVPLLFNCFTLAFLFLFNAKPLTNTHVEVSWIAFEFELSLTLCLLSHPRGRRRGGKHLYGWGRSSRDFYSGWAVTYKRTAESFCLWAWWFLELSPWDYGQLIWRRMWRNSGWKVRELDVLWVCYCVTVWCLCWSSCGGWDCM